MAITKKILIISVLSTLSFSNAQGMFYSNSDEDSNEKSDEDKEDSTTDLHIAVKEDNIEKIKKLLEANVDVNSQTNIRMTPLHWAAATNKDKSVQVLLDAGGDPRLIDKALGLTPLDYALGARYYNIVQIFLTWMQKNLTPEEYEENRSYIEAVMKKQQQDQKPIA